MIRNNKTLFGTILVVTIALLVMYFGRFHKQECREMNIYRTKFGLYICEGPDHEAGEYSVTCRIKMGDIADYFSTKVITTEECFNRYSRATMLRDRIKSK